MYLLIKQERDKRLIEIWRVRAREKERESTKLKESSSLTPQ